MSNNPQPSKNNQWVTLRIVIGGLIGALPGLIWFVTTQFPGALPVLIFGAMIGAGLATPGTSPARVAGGVVSHVGVPGADMVGDAIRKAAEDPEVEDTFGEWLTTGTPNRRAFRMMVLGLGIGVLAAIVFFAADGWAYRRSNESMILSNDWFIALTTYVFLTGAFAVHFSAMLSLTVRGSHWKAILSLGSFGGVFAAIIWFSGNPDNVGPTAAFALLPSTFFLFLGLALGAGAIEDRVPTDEETGEITEAE